MDRQQTLEYLDNIIGLESLIDEETQIQGYLETKIEEYDKGIDLVNEYEEGEIVNGEPNPYKRYLKETDPEVRELIDASETSGVSFSTSVSLLIFVIAFFVSVKIFMGDIDGGIIEKFIGLIISVLFSIPIAFLVGVFVFLILSVILTFINRGNKNTVLENLKQLNREYLSHNIEQYDLREKKKRMIIEEHEIICQSLIEATNTLELYYGYGLIHPNYRNIIPLTTIYDYFDTGRCDNWKEAINLYEAEVRQDMIISNLEKINDSLDVIKEHQRSLYNKLEDIQDSVNAVCGYVRDLECQLASVQQSAEITLYNSKVAAKNAKAAKWYAGFTATSNAFK